MTRGRYTPIIDLSDGTNLAVAAPITLTGDTIGISLDVGTTVREHLVWDGSKWTKTGSLYKWDVATGLLSVAQITTTGQITAGTSLTAAGIFLSAAAPVITTVLPAQMLTISTVDVAATVSGFINIVTGNATGAADSGDVTIGTGTAAGTVGSVLLESGGITAVTIDENQIATFVNTIVGSITGNAGTLTVAVEPDTDTSMFVGLWSDASGSLAAKTDANLTYNADTNMLSVGSGNFIGRNITSDLQSTTNFAFATSVSTITVNAKEAIRCTGTKAAPAVIINNGSVDMDFKVNGEDTTGFINFIGDSGLESLTLGDGGVTDYCEWDNNGNLDFNGAAELTFNSSIDSGATANEVSIGGYELSAGNRALSISQEAVVAADTDETKFSNKLPVRINGVNYYVMLTTT